MSLSSRVHDEDAILGPGAALANIISCNEVRGSRLLFIRAHGQKARRFVHDQNVTVFIDNHESAGQLFGSSFGIFTHSACRVGSLPTANTHCLSNGK